MVNSSGSLLGYGPLYFVISLDPGATTSFCKCIRSRVLGPIRTRRYLVRCQGSFLPKFLKYLVEEAKSQATLAEIAKKKASSHPKDQPAASTSQQRKSIDYSYSTSRNGYVTLSPCSFGGQTSLYIATWRRIPCDPWILETVEKGFTLDFMSRPTQQNVQHNAAMNSDQIEICKMEVRSLWEKGAITRANECSFTRGFFLVPKASGGWRPIINLKALNLFIPRLHFKMEDVNVLRHTIKQGDWLAKVV